MGSSGKDVLRCTATFCLCTSLHYLEPPSKSSIESHLFFNSLTAIDAHEHQFFDKLLWGLVTSTIFVRF